MARMRATIGQRDLIDFAEGQHQDIEKDLSERLDFQDRERQKMLDTIAHLHAENAQQRQIVAEFIAYLSSGCISGPHGQVKPLMELLKRARSLRDQGAAESIRHQVETEAPLRRQLEAHEEYARQLRIMLRALGDGIQANDKRDVLMTLVLKSRELLGIADKTAG